MKDFEKLLKISGLILEDNGDTNDPDRTGVGVKILSDKEREAEAEKYKKQAELVDAPSEEPKTEPKMSGSGSGPPKQPKGGDTPTLVTYDFLVKNGLRDFFNPDAVDVIANILQKNINAYLSLSSSNVEGVKRDFANTLGNVGNMLSSLDAKLSSGPSSAVVKNIASSTMYTSNKEILDKQPKQMGFFVRGGERGGMTFVPESELNERLKFHSSQMLQESENAKLIQDSKKQFILGLFNTYASFLNAMKKQVNEKLPEDTKLQAMFKRFAESYLFSGFVNFEGDVNEESINQFLSQIKPASSKTLAAMGLSENPTDLRLFFRDLYTVDNIMLQDQEKNEFLLSQSLDRPELAHLKENDIVQLLVDFCNVSLFKEKVNFLINAFSEEYGGMTFGEGFKEGGNSLRDLFLSQVEQLRSILVPGIVFGNVSFKQPFKAVVDKKLDSAQETIKNLSFVCAVEGGLYEKLPNKQSAGKGLDDVVKDALVIKNLLSVIPKTGRFDTLAVDNVINKFFNTAKNPTIKNIYQTIDVANGKTALEFVSALQATVTGVLDKASAVLENWPIAPDQMKRFYEFYSSGEKVPMEIVLQRFKGASAGAHMVYFLGRVAIIDIFQNIRAILMEVLNRDEFDEALKSPQTAKPASQAEMAAKLIPVTVQLATVEQLFAMLQPNATAKTPLFLTPTEPPPPAKIQEQLMSNLEKLIKKKILEKRNLKNK
jgi:hypothetical protein